MLGALEGSGSERRMKNEKRSILYVYVYIINFEITIVVRRLQLRFLSVTKQQAALFYHKPGHELTIKVNIIDAGNRTQCLRMRTSDVAITPHRFLFSGYGRGAYLGR